MKYADDPTDDNFFWLGLDGYPHDEPNEVMEEEEEREEDDSPFLDTCREELEGAYGPGAFVPLATMNQILDDFAVLHPALAEVVRRQFFRLCTQNLSELRIHRAERDGAAKTDAAARKASLAALAKSRIL